MGGGWTDIWSLDTQEREKKRDEQETIRLFYPRENSHVQRVMSEGVDRLCSRTKSDESLPDTQGTMFLSDEQVNSIFRSGNCSRK